MQEAWVKVNSDGKVSCPFCGARYTIVIDDDGMSAEEVVKCSHWTGEWDTYLGTPPHVEFLFVSDTREVNDDEGSRR